MALSSKDATEDILAKFPGPAVLYPSKFHLIYLFLASIAFLVGGIFLLHHGGNSGFERAMWIVCVIMGGLGAPMAVSSFLPRAAFLRLDGAGFETAYCFVRNRCAWSDVRNFGVWVGSRGTRRVMFEVRWRSHFVRGMLPDTYGFTADEAAGLMNSWQNLAVSDQTAITRST
jgi:hypothetical protein